ncbi:MAG: hypothetical protein HDS16_03610 [Bacteroides sp.]|nr:hypothetical protein [Bacteroides sp.]MBD5347638.1 hypothetical protein [Bacteroides sp.]
MNRNDRPVMPPVIRRYLPRRGAPRPYTCPVMNRSDRPVMNGVGKCRDMACHV